MLNFGGPFNASFPATPHKFRSPPIIFNASSLLEGDLTYSFSAALPGLLLSVISGKIVRKTYVISLLKDWINTHDIDLILLGNGTTSTYSKTELYSNNINPVELVDETGTTLRARGRYLELCPPQFPISCLPKTLLFPPSYLDSIVALILVEDFTKKKLDWKEPIEIRIWP